MKQLRNLFGIALLAALPVASNAAPVLDGIGDFISQYGGPTTATDLDVVSADVKLYNNTFYFTATMNGAIGSTAGGFYVWGLDRGTGATTSNFASLGLPGIIFDSLFIMNQDGSGRVTTLGAGGTTTNFGAGTFAISGNTFSAYLSASLFPTKGFAIEDYTHNLWPRFGGAVAAGKSPISDFAPNASMAHITVPEPFSLSLLGVGLLALGVSRAKKKSP